MRNGDVVRVPANKHQLDKSKMRIHCHVVLNHWEKHSIASGISDCS